MHRPRESSTPRPGCSTTSRRGVEAARRCGASVGVQAAAHRMVAAGGEVERRIERARPESRASAAPVDELEPPDGERAGLVEDDPPHPGEPVEQVGALTKQPAPAELRLGELVRERHRDPDRAGAGHHQQRHRDLDRAIGAVARSQSANPSAEIASTPTTQPRASTLQKREGGPRLGADLRAAAATSGDSEKSETATTCTAALPRRGTRPPGSASPCCSSRGSGSPVIQSVEKRGLRRAELASTGQRSPGASSEPVARADLRRAAPDSRRVPTQPPDQQPLRAVVVEEEAAVLLEHPLLQPAPEQHQGDEGVQGVEVGEVSAAGAHLHERGAEREQQPDRDRQIEVEHPGAHALPGGAEERPAADEERERRERDGEPGEEAEQLALARGEPGVEAEREEHHVHGDRRADAEPDREVRGAPARALPARAEEVAEPLDLARGSGGARTRPGSSAARPSRARG